MTKKRTQALKKNTPWPTRAAVGRIANKVQTRLSKLIQENPFRLAPTLSTSLTGRGSGSRICSKKKKIRQTLSTERLIKSS